MTWRGRQSAHPQILIVFLSAISGAALAAARQRRLILDYGGGEGGRVSTAGHYRHIWSPHWPPPSQQNMQTGVQSAELPPICFVSCQAARASFKRRSTRRYTHTRNHGEVESSYCTTAFTFNLYQDTIRGLLRDCEIFALTFVWSSSCPICFVRLPCSRLVTAHGKNWLGRPVTNNKNIYT